MDKDKNSSKDDSSKDKDLEKTNAEQANTIAALKNEVKKSEDPNAGPKIIQKGTQVHPKYQKNNIKIPATIPKELLALFPFDSPHSEYAIASSWSVISIPESFFFLIIF